MEVIGLLLLMSTIGPYYVLEASGTSFKLPPDYEKYERPPLPKQNVYIGFDVTDVSEINDNDFTIKLVLSIHLGWNDPRIILNNETMNAMDKESRWHTVLQNEAEELWMPKLFVQDLREEKSINEGKNNYLFTMLTPIPHKTIYHAIQNKYTIACLMDFSKFPFDKHECYFEISFLIPIFEAELFPFLEGDWGKALTTTLLKYDIECIDLPKERKRRMHELFSGYKPEISFAGFKMNLKRKSTPYLFNYYLPSSLFVVVSWVTFTIPVQVVPGRIALLITTFLVLTNIGTSAFSNSPNTQGINSIEVYIVSCLVFVFGATLQYLALLYKRRFLGHQECRMSQKEIDMFGRKWSSKKRSMTHYSSTASYSKDMISAYEDKVDKACLYLFPLAFVLFQIIYWVIVFKK